MVIENFKGQVVESVINKLGDLNIFVCLSPPNTTDRLQPLNLEVNNPVKIFQKGSTKSDTQMKL